jgi:hypothetical protein
VIVATRVWAMNLDLADRACYVVLPILAYIAIAAAALLERWAVSWTFDTLAVALVVILIVGMRNA